jgi:ATP-dependent DNA helicase 2 subunit 2
MVRLTNSDRTILIISKAISAIIVAIQMITEHCKKLKYHRRIVLVTDARGHMDDEDNSEVASQLAQEGIELTVV